MVRIFSRVVYQVSFLFATSFLAYVERVSRVPSTAPSTTDREAFEDDIPTAPEDEDVSMTDDASIKKPKTVAKRKPKAVIPVGRNGLKKRKVTKTRRTIDENGYTRKRTPAGEL